jgi:hypothetical protein
MAVLIENFVKQYIAFFVQFHDHKDQYCRATFSKPHILYTAAHRPFQANTGVLFSQFVK